MGISLVPWSGADVNDGQLTELGRISDLEMISSHSGGVEERNMGKHVQLQCPVRSPIFNLNSHPEAEANALADAGKVATPAKDEEGTVLSIGQVGLAGGYTMLNAEPPGQG